MVYYEPHATVVLTDPATRTYRLTVQVLYPAGVNQDSISTTVHGSKRHATIESSDDPAFRQDHLVTSTVDYTRTTNETEVDVVVQKDGKKKGSTIVIYEDPKSISKAA